MARFDTVIKNGMIIDGTRVPRYRGDIGIVDGKIASIGRIAESDADKVVDATDCIVAPGFIDLHTHYDAQVYWDPYCTLSGWHGVTSVVIGNCGFGFAPVRPEMREVRGPVIRRPKCGSDLRRRNSGRSAIEWRLQASAFEVDATRPDASTRAMIPRPAADVE